MQQRNPCRKVFWEGCLSLHVSSIKVVMLFSLQPLTWPEASLEALVSGYQLSEKGLPVMQETLSSRGLPVMQETFDREPLVQGHHMSQSDLQEMHAMEALGYQLSEKGLPVMQETGHARQLSSRGLPVMQETFDRQFTILNMVPVGDEIYHISGPVNKTSRGFERSCVYIPNGRRDSTGHHGFSTREQAS